VYERRTRNKSAGRPVNTEGYQRPENQGFTMQDILWAVGIWSVILCLSPVILFYLLMVA
jgi:hypothetical protein